MSFSTSIFALTQSTYDEFKCDLEKTLNINFIRDEEADWPLSRYNGLGFSAALIGDLDYDDDMDIPFSKYSYQIDIQIHPRVEEEPIWVGLEYCVSMYIYHCIREVLELECIVVDDMQKLLTPLTPEGTGSQPQAPGTNVFQPNEQGRVAKEQAIDEYLRGLGNVVERIS